jgi:hypothetical protein
MSQVLVPMDRASRSTSTVSTGCRQSKIVGQLPGVQVRRDSQMKWDTQETFQGPETTTQVTRLAELANICLATLRAMEPGSICPTPLCHQEGHLQLRVRLRDQVLTKPQATLAIFRATKTPAHQGHPVELYTLPPSSQAGEAKERLAEIP